MTPIERLAVELHAAILQLRMVPVAQVFRSFSRLVRDMARQLGKERELLSRVAKLPNPTRRLSTSVRAVDASGAQRTRSRHRDS